MRRDEAKAMRATIEYQPSRKRRRGRPREWWFDGVSQDLRTLDVEAWEEIIHYRERWMALTVVAKTLGES
jgi:hypothetical protein